MEVVLVVTVRLSNDLRICTNSHACQHIPGFYFRPSRCRSSAARFVLSRLRGGPLLDDPLISLSESSLEEVSVFLSEFQSDSSIELSGCPAEEDTPEEASETTAAPLLLVLLRRALRRAV